jgi:type VI secretion system secreted protein Hcp
MHNRLVYLASVAAVAFATAALPTAANAAGDAFLKIEGISGESVEPNHQGWIEVKNFSFGVANSSMRTRQVGGSSEGPGRVSIVKEVDKTSPLLKQRLAAGGRFAEVILAVRKAGGGSSAYMNYVLHDAMVSSFSKSGGGDRPQESISLNYNKLEWSYGR